MPILTTSPLERLKWVEQPNGCWYPTLAASLDGYVYIGRGGRAGGKVLVHRLVFEHHNGPIPPGLDIDHNCHNVDTSCVGGPACMHRRCVNPAHLRAATRSLNIKSGRRWH